MKFRYAETSMQIKIFDAQDRDGNENEEKNIAALFLAMAMGGWIGQFHTRRQGQRSESVC